MAEETTERSQAEIEAERMMEQELAAFNTTAQEGQVAVQTAGFQTLEASPSDDKERKLDILMDLTLPISIELGRTNMLIRDILDLKRGQVVEFEKLASEPVDILVNGKKMAEGEVVVIEKHFGIRITHLVETSERIKGLGK